MACKGGVYGVYCEKSVIRSPSVIVVEGIDTKFEVMAKLPLSCPSLKSRTIVNIVLRDLIVLQHLATIVMSQQALCH